MPRREGMKQYATVGWTVEDVQSVNPEWSEEKAEDFLRGHRRAIEERIIEAGWEVLEELMAESEEEDNSHD